ncbi:MAG: DUF4388 domain-containing protein [Acidobacteriota bacterium]
MAIFGHLQDLPFPEIFNMLGRRTGRLDIQAATDYDLSLHLRDGSLRGLTIGTDVVVDPVQVRDRLASLMDTSSGTFEFHRCAPELLRDDLALPMTQLLLSIASVVDEIGAYRERFAHPRTRFRAIAAGRMWLDDELYDFFVRAEPILAVGADAQELAAALDVGLEQVQLHLYKLRSIGRIAPVRAAEVTHGADAELAPTPVPRSTTDGEQLLRPLDASAVPARIARENLFEHQAPPAAPLFGQRTRRTGRGLFRRLLDAFRAQTRAVA